MYRLRVSAIVLANYNARYQHAAFGLRYLQANLGSLRPDSALLEFDLHQPPDAAAGKILAHQPRIVGLGVYIWNVHQTGQLAAALRRAAPDVVIVLGGPEISFETETHPLTPLADYVICGEADLFFAELCRAILAAQPPAQKILQAPPPDVEQLVLPYDLYSDHDLATRLTYLEASRGCPFGCEYCVSSVERGVRRFDWARLRPEFERLLARGLRRIKFVDRTFNLDVEFGSEVLEFFYAYAAGRATPPAEPQVVTGGSAGCLRWEAPPGQGRLALPTADLQVHLEIAPACLTPAWRELLRRAPAGLLRLEVGVQTFDEAINARIGRRQAAAEAEEALRFLREETGALIHADLIAGLPGQTLEAFGADFDRMVGLRPHEIQVGVLKRLRGTTIDQHDAEWGVMWNAEPPYDILSNRLLDAATMEQIKRFARCWEILGNRGHFEKTLPLLWNAPNSSPFSVMWEFSGRLFARFGKVHSIALFELARALFDYLAEVQGASPAIVAEALRSDLAGLGALHLPNWLHDL